MNEQETLALHGMGREAWNEWAAQVLKSKAQFQQNGLFSLNWFDEAGNEETRLWLGIATANFSAAHLVDEANFEGFIFPGPVLFNSSLCEAPLSFAGAEFHLNADFTHARFQSDVSFKGAKFLGQAVFDDAIFDAVGDFERAEFMKEKNGPLDHAVKFQRTRFMGRADFRSSVYAGSGDFSKAQFAATSRFDEARFIGTAGFEGAVFSAPASFNAGQFLENANFKDAQFTGEVRFSEALFNSDAVFSQCIFWAGVSFRDARFEKAASFGHIRAEGAVRFKGAKFASVADFAEARIAAEADFSEASFDGPAGFNFANFAHGASWKSCAFGGNADFSGLTVARRGAFEASRFEGDAIFLGAQFDAPVSFASARFAGNADFSAMQSKVAFVIAGAEFQNVPGFLEASFREPPRVDHLFVADPLKRFHNWKELGQPDPRGPSFKLWPVAADADASAKFRRLKKLASEAQDHPREQDFYAQELRCQRFWHDKPFGKGKARFWLGWLYGGLANFGRSILRPALAWLLSVFVFALFYFAQQGSAWNVHQPPAAIGDWFKNLIAGETLPCVSGSSSRAGEALLLSARNAVLKIDWADAAAARRVFGCLYGIDASGTAIIPLSVSAVSLFQAIVSGCLLFLFLLALRNLLKVR